MQFCGEKAHAVNEYRHFICKNMRFTANTRSSKRDNSIVRTVSGCYYKLLHILAISTMILENVCVGIGAKCVFRNVSNLPENVFSVKIDDQCYVFYLTSILC